MATYLPNVKDYIPNVKAYTPDFKFLSDALDQRQDRYNKTTKQLNNLYGDVVYADLSREDNQSVRDDYAKLLAPKIQQISGLDFSLSQNVQAAQGLFKPFYEDQHVVRDIVFTKAYKDQMSFANGLKSSVSDKQRDRYWDKGVEYMNFMMKDFKEKSREDSMGVQLPQYYEDPDIYERSMEALKTGGPDGKGLKATDMYVDGTGQFIVTQENGVTLLNKPTGKTIANPEYDPNKKESASNPKTIPEMYNPAANHALQTIGDDPIINQGLRIAGYVDARKFWEAKAEETGQPTDVFKKEWAKTQLDKFSTQVNQTLQKENVELNKTNQELASWDEYTKEAPLIKDSDEYKKWFMAMTRGETISAGIQKLENKRDNILNDIDEEDIDAYMNRGYAAYMSSSLQGQVFAAARNYADATSKRTFTESKIYIEKLRARNNENLKRLERSWELADQLQETLQEIENASNVPVPVEGDARENIAFQGTIIEQNEKGELKVIKDIQTRQIQAITSFYSFMADDMNTDVNLQNMASYTITDENSTVGEVKSSGIFIPNKNSGKLDFYRWQDAVEVLKQNPQILNYHYDRIMNIHTDQDQMPSYKKEDKSGLRDMISSLSHDVTMRNNKLDLVYDIQNKVYKNILAQMDINSIRAGLGNENVVDWDIQLFDDDGVMKTTKRIYNEKIKEVESRLQTSMPKTLPSTQEITNMFYKNGTWQTTDGEGDGYNPNAGITTEEANYHFQRGGIQSLMMAYYKPFVADAAALFKQDPAVLIATYYQQPSDANQKIKLIPKPNSKNDVYTDIAEDYLSWGSFKPVIDKIKGKMSEEMSKETAVPYETTFDFNSFYYNNETEGDAAIAPIIPYRYDAGTKDKYVNNALDLFFNAYDNMPDNQMFLSEGDQGANFSMEFEDSDRKIAEFVLQQIRADRNYNPGSGKETAGTPGYRIEYSSVGGGEDAEGQYAMYKFILDADYAKSIAKNAPMELESKLQDNTLTVFFNKDLFSNPLDPEQQYTSFVKNLIEAPDNQGQATLNIENGGIIHFEMNSGLITQKWAKYTYDVNTGNMVLGGFSSPQPLVTAAGAPLTDYNIDRVWKDQRTLLQQHANTNLQAQKSHKLNQPTSDTESE